jgi:hypothetical protein
MTDKEQSKPELTETEKRMLRSLRFASGGDMTTEEARNQMVTEKQKIEERKKRFGLELDAEAEKQKMLEREKRFGIPSEEEEKQKIESRKKRFETGNNNEQIIQARKERFKEQYDSNNKNTNNNIRSRGGRRIRQRKVFRSKIRNNNNNMNKRPRRTGRPIGRKRLPMKRRIRKLARKN